MQGFGGVGKGSGGGAEWGIRGGMEALGGEAVVVGFGGMWVVGELGCDTTAPPKRYLLHFATPTSAPSQKGKLTV